MNDKSQPPSWCIGAFEDVFAIESDEGRRLPESEYLLKGDYPVIDQGEKPIGGYCNNGSLRYGGALPVILFGDHTRRAKLIEHEFIVGAQGVKILRPRRGIDSRFLYYQFPVLELPDRGYSRHFQFLRKVSFSLAPRPEQSRIVAEIEKQFTRLDAATAALKRVQANLKRHRASVLKAACEGRLVPTEAELARKEGRDYEPAGELLKRILRERRAHWEADTLAKLIASGKRPTDDRWKDKYKEPSVPDAASLPALAEGWSWASVEQLNPAERPCAYGVLQPGSHVPDGVPLIRVGDIEDGVIRTEELKRITRSIAKAYPRTCLSGGEVLITLVGAIGRTAVVPSSLAGANTARAVGVLPIRPNTVSPEWVEIWFRNPEMTHQMIGKAHEVARMTLNLEDVRTAAVAIPPKQEQCRIVDAVLEQLGRFCRLTEAVEHQLKRADRLRQSVLGSAFSGQLVPQDPTDEPAAALLDRIRAERNGSAAKKPTRRSQKELVHA